MINMSESLRSLLKDFYFTFILFIQKLPLQTNGTPWTIDKKKKKEKSQ